MTTPRKQRFSVDFTSPVHLRTRLDAIRVFKHQHTMLFRRANSDVQMRIKLHLLGINQPDMCYHKTALRISVTAVMNRYHIGMLIRPRQQTKGKFLGWVTVFLQTSIDRCAEPTVTTKIGSKTTWTLQRLVNMRQKPGRKPRLAGGRWTPTAVQANPAVDNISPPQFAFDFDDDLDTNSDFSDASGFFGEDVGTSD
jgi:hypothetical protein